MSHKVILHIKNGSGHVMTYRTDKFVHGHLDGSSWPAKIPNAGHPSITCSALDGSILGCSGYVTYTMGGSEVTIAFSNPEIGTNKLGVGTSGEEVWENMDNHDYQPFQINITLSDGTQLTFNCKCTGGDTNDCEVRISN